MARRATDGWFLIALLTALSALGQFATSVYLPSLPAIERDLGASASAVQATLSVYLFVFAGMQLVWGPIMDRFGRRGALLTGLAIYLAGSALCFDAASVEWLTIGRVLQALGASAGVVGGRAVVRDLFDGAAMTRVMATMAIAFSAIPAIAPIIGGLLQAGFDWHAPFAATFIFGAIIAVAAMLRLPETLDRRIASLAPLSVIRSYLGVLTVRSFVGHTLIGGAVMGALFAFLTGSPAVLIGGFGINPAEYGLYPALTVPGFIASGLVVRRLSGRVSDARLTLSGLMLTVLGSSLLMAFVSAGMVNRYTISCGMLLFVAGMGLVLPLSSAGAIRPFRARAGTASALMGATQMAMAATCSAAVAVVVPLLGHAAFPAVMVGVSVASLPLLWLLREPPAQRG